MRKFTYEEIIKKFNECILGRTNEYYPKLALSYDHDGFSLFFQIEQIDIVLTVSMMDEILVARSLTYMTGQQFAIHMDDDRMPIFVELPGRHK